MQHIWLVLWSTMQQTEVSALWPTVSCIQRQQQPQQSHMKNRHKPTQSYHPQPKAILYQHKSASSNTTESDNNYLSTRQLQQHLSGYRNQHTVKYVSGLLQIIKTCLTLTTVLSLKLYTSLKHWLTLHLHINTATACESSTCPHYFHLTQHFETSMTMTYCHSVYQRSPRMVQISD